MKYRSIPQLAKIYGVPYNSVFRQVKRGVFKNIQRYENRVVVSEKEFVQYNHGNKRLNKEAQAKLAEAFSSFQR